MKRAAGSNASSANEVIKHISKASIKGIKIPIPSLEKQNEIVVYCENYENINMQLEKDIENNKKHIQEYITDITIYK